MCLIVQIKEKNMKIGFGMLIYKLSGPTLDFAHECHNIESKMADIENVVFRIILDN